MIKVILTTLLFIGCSNTPVNIEDDISAYDKKNKIEPIDCNYAYNPIGFCATQEDLYRLGQSW